MATPNHIISELLRARWHAFAPISKFMVGCVIEDIFGRFFYGANSEFEDRRAGLCAESAAVADMCAKVGATFIKNIYLCGAPENDKSYNEPVFPCGLCRQRLLEISDENTQFISVNQNKEIIFTCPFSELVPHSFTSDDTKQFIEYMSTKRKPLALDKDMPIDEKLELLKELSFPLSGKKEACIIELRTGELIGGNYFGTSCYKADIDARTAAYAMLLQMHCIEEIKKVYFSD